MNKISYLSAMDSTDEDAYTKVKKFYLQTPGEPVWYIGLQHLLIHLLSRYAVIPASLHLVVVKGAIPAQPGVWTDFIRFNSVLICIHYIGETQIKCLNLRICILIATIHSAEVCNLIQSSVILF